MELIVRVTDDFSLNAGMVTEDDDLLLILPPERLMFQQLYEWLEQLPEPNIGYNYWALGIGATALCLRWGTYLAVLMDDSKPVDPRAKDVTQSMISDQEMKRINIEASHNLNRLLRLWYVNELLCLDILRRAYEWLPMPQRRVKRNRETLNFILRAFKLVHELKDEDLRESSRAAIAHPMRALANTIIALAYRNGSIEDMHNGLEAAYCLDRRRFTDRQAGEVIRHTAERISAIWGIGPLWREELPPFPPWPERVAGLPYIWLYPHGWSLTESTSQIQLLKRWME